MSDKFLKSYFTCWFAPGADDDSEEVNKLKTALETSKHKLNSARKEIKRLKGDNLKLMSMVNVSFSNHSSEDVCMVEATSIVIHDREQKASECESDKTSSSMKKTVFPKFKKNDHYTMLDDTDYFDDEEDDSDLLRHQLRTLQRKLQETETNHQQWMQSKEDEIKKLNRQLEKYEHNETGSRSNSISHASRSSSVTRMLYDDVDEQIQILNTPLLKQKSWALCHEQCAISSSSKSKSKNRDKGLITFFAKYMNEKIVDQIFVKSGEAQKSDTTMITNASGLVNVLSFAVILYKVKVHHVTNGKDRPKIDNADIKNSVKFLAIWIVRSYGIKTNHPQINAEKEKAEYSVYEFKCSKDEFAANIVSYLTAFVETDGKHSDSKKNSVKFLAIWIVRSYGIKTNHPQINAEKEEEYSVYEFKCSKDEFAANIVSYLTAFVETDGKHSDSKL
eukprot:CAMPEP_0202728660 /NCGR_PEP_ID=MMETSP1385-20130828/185739_1 /ASSEMBLY_ACC=CAM_ASM_000861 /TAXON_ID=933848 /ORGANISM="Elphidium margaritaceum" /LENGTH=446 /DNA_ID=CAMNT_0049394911 /DNA_START=48 /DNA_END=1388 /DNA_ORIENTATION=-